MNRSDGERTRLVGTPAAIPVADAQHDDSSRDSLVGVTTQVPAAVREQVHAHVVETQLGADLPHRAGDLADHQQLGEHARTRLVLSFLAGSHSRFISLAEAGGVWSKHRNHLFLRIVNCTGDFPATLRAFKTKRCRDSVYGNHFFETLEMYFTPNYRDEQVTCGQALEYQEYQDRFLEYRHRHSLNDHGLLHVGHREYGLPRKND